MNTAYKVCAIVVGLSVSGISASAQSAHDKIIGHLAQHATAFSISQNCEGLTFRRDISNNRLRQFVERIGRITTIGKAKKILNGISAAEREEAVRNVFAENGVSPLNEQTVCAFGHSEKSKRTLIGSLLQ